jgi:hypothetical protein
VAFHADQGRGVEGNFATLELMDLGNDAMHHHCFAHMLSRIFTNSAMWKMECSSL